MASYKSEEKEKKQALKSDSKRSGNTIQNKGIHLEDNRPHASVQRKHIHAAAKNAQNHEGPIQKNENKTGLPDKLKSGIENLSGHAMDDVKVHYNSNKPAQLNAHAYAQGADIHLAAGQEKYLPHEAWHVVQQKQGRVKPTKQLKGKIQVNDNIGLENEADVMGSKALQSRNQSHKEKTIGDHENSFMQSAFMAAPVAQLFFDVFSKGRAAMLLIEGALHISAGIAGIVLAAAVSPLVIPGILAILGGAAQLGVGLSKWGRAILMFRDGSYEGGKLKPSVKKGLSAMISIEAVLWGLSIPSIAAVGGGTAIAAATLSSVGAGVKFLRGIFTTSEKLRPYLGYIVILESVLGGVGNILAVVIRSGIKAIATMSPAFKGIANLAKSIRGIIHKRGDVDKDGEKQKLISSGNEADNESEEV